MDYSVGDTQIIGYSNTKLDQIMTSFHNQKYAEVIIKASYGSLTHNSFPCISLFSNRFLKETYPKSFIKTTKSVMSWSSCANSKPNFWGSCSLSHLHSRYRKAAVLEEACPKDSGTTFDRSHLLENFFLYKYDNFLFVQHLYKSSVLYSYQTWGSWKWIERLWFIIKGDMLDDRSTTPKNLNRLDKCVSSN